MKNPPNPAEMPPVKPIGDRYALIYFPETDSVELDFLSYYEDYVISFDSNVIFPDESGVGFLGARVLEILPEGWTPLQIFLNCKER